MRGLEHDFELMRDAMDVVTRVVPPSTHSAPKKGEFKITKLVLDPWRLFEFSPAPNANANETHDAAHMDYALVAIDPKTLTDEIPREWLRSLEDAAVFGYHPARDAHNLLGVAPKRWLDPAFCAVGKTQSGSTGAAGASFGTKETPRALPRRLRNVSSVSARASSLRSRVFLPRTSSAGGAVLACMTDESARPPARARRMAADTRRRRRSRPCATPLIGYGDWGVLVGMHRGAVFGNEGEKPMSDVLRITDIVADLARRREKRENPAEESSVAGDERRRRRTRKNREKFSGNRNEDARRRFDGRFAGGGAAGILARRRRDAGGCRLAQAASMGGGDDDKKVTLKTTRRCSNITRLNGDETRRPFH